MSDARREFLESLFWSASHHVFEDAMAALCPEAAEEWLEHREEILAESGPDSEALFETWWTIYHRHREALEPLRRAQEERQLRQRDARLAVQEAETYGSLRAAIDGVGWAGGVDDPALRDELWALVNWIELGLPLPGLDKGAVAARPAG